MNRYYDRQCELLFFNLLQTVNRVIMKIIKYAIAMSRRECITKLANVMAAVLDINGRIRRKSRRCTGQDLMINKI